MVYVEILSTAASVIVLLLASFIPYFGLKNDRLRLPSGLSSANALSVCNCFAAGIFLATCFLGLIPHIEMNEQRLLDTLTKQGNVSTVGPLQLHQLVNTNLVVLIGFLLIVLVEQSVFLCTPSHMLGSHSRDAHYTPTPTNRNQSGNSGSSPRRGRHSDHEAVQPLVFGGLSDEDSDDGDFGRIEFRTEPPKPEHDHAHAGHSHHHSLPSDGSFIQLVLLLLALSVHSIFEGVALGAQQNTQQFLKFLVSVMLHEVLCSFAFGVSLTQQKTSSRTAILSVLFLSFSIPIGMLIMVFVGAFDATTSLAIRFVLEGLAAGIFIYVACVEMLAEELSHDKADRSGFVKAIAVSLGAIIFFVLNVLISGD